MNDDPNVIDGPWQGRPETNICPHETPGGRQRCALCRREVERQHEGWDSHQHEPAWKQVARLAERQAVPMPDHVRAEWDKLRQGPRAGGQQGQLL